MTTARFAPAFRSYVTPAMARPQLWRLAVGILLCAAIYVVWIAVLLAGLWWLTGTGNVLDWAGPVLTGQTPRGTLILLYSFVGMGLGPIVAVRVLHKRRAGSLFGRASVVICDFATAALIVGLVYAIGTALWLWQFDAQPNIDPVLWLQLLPLALLGLSIQTGAEELVFRGYLQQQLAARFASPLIWLVLPALIFGAVHYDPATAGSNVWLMMGAAAIFGLVAADLTAVTGSIGAAWGFHFANNMVALLILSLQGTLSGLSLYTTPYGPDDLVVLPGLVLADLAVLALTWALVRRAVRR